MVEGSFFFEEVSQVEEIIIITAWRLWPLLVQLVAFVSAVEAQTNCCTLD